jgi:hypothetical protein
MVRNVRNAARTNATVPCKVTSATSGTFQTKANTSVTVQLCDAPGVAAAKCQFNGVTIFPSGSTVPVPGQPISTTGTEFTFSLPAGKYHVSMGLAPLPGCGVVFAVEKCTSPNPVCLDTMAPQIQPSGIFVIEVI